MLALQKLKEYAATDRTAIIHRGLPAAAFGSYGWSGEAVPNLTARMEALKLGQPLPGLKIRFKPSDAQLAEARQYGRDFAAAVLK